MTRILLSAFEPYDEWAENSSWLTLVEMTRWFDHGGRVVTRRYPVSLSEVTRRLGEDFASEYDYAVHLGQAPGASAIQFEAIGLNVDSAGRGLVPGAPVAYRTALPLGRWVEKVRESGIPADVSYHAGTYLCNAIYFLSQHLASTRSLATQSVFIHLPLAPVQAARQERTLPSMGTPLMAAAVATVLAQLLESPAQA